MPWKHALLRLSFRPVLLNTLSLLDTGPWQGQISCAMPDALPEQFAEELTIVFLGSLNAAIFNPDWFVRHGLIGAETAAEADVRMISREVTELDLGHITLQCDDGRLSLRTTRATHSEMLFDLGRGILRTLPHTPITAAGINNDIHYRLPSEEMWHRIGHGLAPKDPVWSKLCNKPGMLKLTIQGQKEDWDYPLREHFTVEPYPSSNTKHPAVIIRANLHFAISREILTASAIAADLAFDFLEAQWQAGIVRGREVAAEIFATYKDD